MHLDRRQLSGFLALVVSMMAIPASTPASAQFAAPFFLSNSDATHVALAPKVAVNSNGDAAAVWRRNDGTHYRVQARMRSAAGVLGPIQDLTDPGTDAIAVPQVGINDAGDAAFIWQLFSGAIQARSLSAAGALGPIQSIGQVSNEVSDPRLAIGSDGKVVFVWSDSVAVHARILTGAGALLNAMDISTASQSVFPSVAMDSVGNAIFVWGVTNTAVQSRTLSASGILRRIVTVSHAPPFDLPQIAVDQGADAAFTWNVFNGSNTLVQARNRSAAGVFGAIAPLTHPGRDARNPQIGIDGGGNAVIVWSRLDASGFDRVQVSTLTAGSVVGATRTVSAANHHAFNPQVAVDAAGDAVLVWERSDGVNERIQSVTLSSTGVLSSVQSLSHRAENCYEPQVGISGSGKAVAVWRSGTNFRIQGAATQ
jgi:hypothetical protein